MGAESEWRPTDSKAQRKEQKSEKQSAQRQRQKQQKEANPYKSLGDALKNWQVTDYSSS